MKSFDLVVELVKERRNQLRNVEKYLRVLKSRAKKLFGHDVRLYLFGSFARKQDFFPFLSDIDVLIVSKKVSRKISERAKIKTKLLKGLPDFFEIHLTDEEIFNYYKFFCSEELKAI
jgi:predicted nucleotidyltransferase